jgi:crotonobetainyl-CoA:carnitine CoA-transferase CaiB-like acyl-CoA transferase
MTLPLSGIRIADFSHVMAGPYASHLLCLMGAEVIKIEPKGGDNFRNYGADRRYDGMSPAFIAANAGKKSIALDLKDEADFAVAKAWVLMPSKPLSRISFSAPSPAMAKKARTVIGRPSITSFRQPAG